MARWTKKNQKVYGLLRVKRALEEPKEMLMSAPVVALSASDGDFTVSCDVSRVGLGCVLM